MRKTYGDLRLWLWSLLPTIHLLAVGVMLWRKDYLNAVTFTRSYDHYTAFYLVPPDAVFAQCRALSAQTAFLLCCSVIAYPLILRYYTRKGTLCSSALRLHIGILLAGLFVNYLFFHAVGSYWWWATGEGEPL